MEVVYFCRGSLAGTPYRARRLAGARASRPPRPLATLGPTALHDNIHEGLAAGVTGCSCPPWHTVCVAAGAGAWQHGKVAVRLGAMVVSDAALVRTGGDALGA